MSRIMMFGLSELDELISICNDSLQFLSGLQGEHDEDRRIDAGFDTEGDLRETIDTVQKMKHRFMNERYTAEP